MAAFSGTRPRAYFVQCTRFDLVESALVALREAAGPGSVIGVYANDGRSWDHDAKRWEGERITPEAYARRAQDWVSQGARIVGGCCGTGPEHIEHLRKTLLS